MENSVEILSITSTPVPASGKVDGDVDEAVGWGGWRIIARRWARVGHLMIRRE